jgi:hypothetical protein
MEGGASRSTRQASFNLGPLQTKSLDVASRLSLSGLKNFNGTLNLILEVEGPQNSVLLSSGSVDKSWTYVFEVVPRGVKESGSKNLSYWSTANGDDTMVTLWNPVDESQDFVFKIFFSGGHYLLPVHLAARATHVFNLSEVIEAQSPDSEGNLIPLGVKEGSAQISGPQAENELILVSMDAGTYNVRKATCAYRCINCNGAVSWAIAANPFSVTVGDSTQLAFTTRWNTGLQYDRTLVSTWSSNNNNIATVSKGLVHGMDAGGVTVNSDDNSEPWSGQSCGSPPLPCPPEQGISLSAPGAACDFDIQPAGGLTATYCDDKTDNYQAFGVSGIPSGCTISSAKSACGATGTPNVSIDEDPGKTGWNVTKGWCDVYYWASGTSGQDVGNYSTTIQLQFYPSTKIVTHTVSGPVTCK